MHKVRVTARTGAVLALVGAFLLTACTSVNVEPQPSAELQVLEVQLNPELNWMLSDLNACASSSQGLNLQVDPLPDSQTGLSSADLAIFWSSQPPQGNVAYELGSESLQVVVNPANPLESISAESLVTILAGQAVKWSAVESDASLGSIQPWIYPDGLAARSLIDENILKNTRLDPEILLAPGPQEMLEAMAANPGGIGFLPSGWVDDTVKAVAVSDLPQGMSLPILAVTASQPSGSLRDMLLCLQTHP